MREIVKRRFQAYLLENFPQSELKIITDKKEMIEYEKKNPVELPIFFAFGSFIPEKKYKIPVRDGIISPTEIITISNITNKQDYLKISENLKNFEDEEIETLEITKELKNIDILGDLVELHQIKYKGNDPIKVIFTIPEVKDIINWEYFQDKKNICITISECLDKLERAITRFIDIYKKEPSEWKYKFLKGIAVGIENELLLLFLYTGFPFKKINIIPGEI